MAGKTFSGGAELEAKLKEIAAKLGKSNSVNVGFLEGATYPDGTPVAQIAAQNEFGGTVTVPEHTVSINRSIKADGSFNKNGRFVKASKANFQTDHFVKEYTVVVPARQFFRGMIKAKKGGWPKDLGKIIKAADYDADVALDRFGARVAGQLRKSIRDFNDPPNAKSTIAKKGFDDPLIESGHMLNSVDHEVES
ncbi:hypothetical protein [Robbsia sp. KACC 23696]|uniref:hypothetical protein n=1 Tax=Robbsia sp. KACC 23696 TaxID=3149231 RepID=UPI00325B90BB